MLRRSFFRAIAGAPLTAPAARPATATATVLHGVHCATCGYPTRAQYEFAMGRAVVPYLYCSNPKCPELGKAKRPPTVEVRDFEPAQSAKWAAERREQDRRAKASDAKWMAKNADNCTHSTPICECGSVLFRRVARDVNYRVTAEFLTCTHPPCRHAGKPLAVPRHSLYGASDDVVAKVREYEAAQLDQARWRKPGFPTFHE